MQSLENALATVRGIDLLMGLPLVSSEAIYDCKVVFVALWRHVGSDYIHMNV